MLNFSYFKYLFKSKKYLLLIILLITVLINMTGGDVDDKISPKVTGVFAFCIFLAYALPYLLFSYIHSNKAIDSYLSLNVSRKQLLFTGLLFILIGVYTPFLITILFNLSAMIKIDKLLLAVVLLLTVLLSFICLISFNTLTYLFANNTFDGIAISAAYNLLPLFLYLVFFMFTETYICGFDFYSTGFFGYISPFYLGLASFETVFEAFGETFFYIEGNMKILIVSQLILTALCVYGMMKQIIHRKSERAGSSSSYPLAYPSVIYCYTFLVLLAIVMDPGMEFDLNPLLFVFAFIFFAIAQFVYRRKIYIDVKMAVSYLLMILASITFCFVAGKKCGRMISELYPKDREKVHYSLDMTLSPQDEMFDWFIDKIHESSNMEWHYVFIDVRYSATKKPMKEEAYKIFDRIRQSSIDHFYDPEEPDPYKTYCVLYVTNNYTGLQNNRKEKDLRYFRADGITAEELMKLSEDDNAVVSFEYEDTQYILKKGILYKQNISVEPQIVE